MTVETPPGFTQANTRLARPSSSPMVKIYNHFDELPPAYAEFFQENAVSNFYNSLPWYRHFVATALDPDDRIGVYAAERDGIPVAALPVRYKTPHSAWGLRTLSGLSSYYTTLFEPIVDLADNPQANLGAIAQAIRDSSPRWDVVNIKPVLRDSPAFSELVQAFEKADFVVQTYFVAGNWYCPIDGRSYQEYFAGLGGAFRNIRRRKNKKLEQSGRVRADIITGFDGLEAAIDAYEKVYAASWKVPEPYPLFMPGLIRTCAQNGWLRLGVAYVDDAPAAAQLWIVKDGKAAIYKLAYDEQFKDLSVGSYLTMKLMERVIDGDRVQEVDYLYGDDPYKQNWMSQRRELWGILAMNPRTVGGLLSILRHVGGRAVKDMTRRIVTRNAEKQPS